jgi:hypothetical protein
MALAIQETHTLNNFTTDPARFLKKLRRKGGPILLTVEGEVGVIVQDAVSYQRFLELVDRLETIAAVKEGLRDVKAGRTRPARTALREISRKHRLPLPAGG